MVNLLNPQLALFFLAFLLQFISLDAGPASIQMLILGVFFILIGCISDSIYALLAGNLGQWLKRSTVYLLIKKYVSGFLYIALVIKALAVAPEKKPEI